MIRSMTGFGDASAQVDGAHYFVELRSLNNKYFKCTVRVAEQYQGLEAEFESVLRSRISRGTVTVTARCTETTEAAAHDINTKALEAYAAKLRATPLFAGGKKDLDLTALLALPGVLQPPADEEERFERAKAAFLPLLDRACGQLVAMREREGKALVADLREQGKLIGSRLKHIQDRAPAVVADYEQRLKTRIETMLREAEVKYTLDPADLIREIAVYAERTDIAEEIKRLGTHLQQFGDLISGSEPRPIGRTLDFLAQEMLREANTIASKSPDASISRWTVDVKGAIDRIKEQAANIE